MSSAHLQQKAHQTEISLLNKCKIRRSSPTHTTQQRTHHIFQQQQIKRVSVETLSHPAIPCRGATIHASHLFLQTPCQETI